MPWSFFPDVDDTIHDWLKSLYTAYRNSLVDPSIIPILDDIDWDTFWAGLHDTSFMVYEEETTHTNLGLGVKNLEFRGTHVVRVTNRWIGAGKPVVIKHMREFVTRRLHENLVPLPSALSSAGIIEMWPQMTSRIFPETRSAQEDFWVFELKVSTKVLNTIV
jgi:hypothetical protein